MEEESKYMKRTLLDANVDRARAAKGKYAMTELSKAQNRMAFGTAEEEINVGDETEGLGMVGVNSGRIRAAAADSRSKGRFHGSNTREKSLHLQPKYPKQHEQSSCGIPHHRIMCLVSPHPWRSRQCKALNLWILRAYSNKRRKSRIDTLGHRQTQVRCIVHTVVN